MTQRREPQGRRRLAIGLNRMSLVHSQQHSSNSPVQWPEKAFGRVHWSRVRSLLVPLDGSLTAEHALPYALAIARRSGAAIQLVHVHSLLDVVSPWQLYYSDQLVEPLRSQKQAYLQSVLRRVRREVDVQVTALVRDSSEIAHSLCEAAAGASLVIMATHGRGLVGRLLHGSVADALMRMSPCPVLLVHGDGSAVDLTSDPMPRHVLVPLDGTTFAEGVFDAAATLGSLGGARFTLAHFQRVGEAQRWPDRSGAHGYLQEAAMRFKRRVPDVNTEFVLSNQRISRAIQSLIVEEGIDMVALTTHGRQGLARLVKGSVAAAVARRVKMPVLVVCPSVQMAERQDRIWHAPLGVRYGRRMRDD